MITDEIRQCKESWGDRLLILGHHYQCSEVVACCDAVGDSLELSRLAADSTAERIVFCGVRFMAETADILSRAEDGRPCGRSVWLPDPGAGCPMADMATEPALEAAWQALSEVAGEPLVPVVYVNSSAEVKAFCGRHGGAACTSGNGRRVVKHFLDQGKRIFFAPDQHLCTNILRELGYPPSAVGLWRRGLELGGLSAEQIRAARLIAWDGCCPIHAGYTVQDVSTARAQHLGARLLIHPEAPAAVASLADQTGSTRAIIDAVRRSDENETLLIGTEQHLVDRLARDYPSKTILPLRPIICEDMDRTTPAQLLDLLTRWPEECQVQVPDAIVPDARVCVERMLAL